MHLLSGFRCWGDVCGYFFGLAGLSRVRVTDVDGVCRLKDDDLAGRMGLQLKELNKLMAVLEGDRLVQVYVSYAVLR